MYAAFGFTPRKRSRNRMEHQPRDVLQDVGPPEQNSGGSEKFSVTQTLCASVGTATIAGLGRVCANSFCSLRDVLQPWTNFFSKGNRHTSRCKSCLSKERADAYKKKRRAIAARKWKVCEVKEVVFGECAEPASNELDSILSQLAFDAFSGIEA